MKVFALILLFVAAASARSTGVRAVGARAELGDNPWLVHLRVAVGTSGFLESCAGSLVDPRWVLTSASCVSNSRFIWVRYGVVNVFSPSLVTETNAVRVHPQYNAASGANNVALISINRHVLNPVNPNIGVVTLASAGAAVPESARFCGFGENENGGPGERLACIDVYVSEEDGLVAAESDDGQTVQATRFDFGAPLVKDGVQYGVLVKEAVDQFAGFFLNPAEYRGWIETTAGIVLPGSDDDNDDD